MPTKLFIYLLIFLFEIIKKAESGYVPDYNPYSAEIFVLNNHGDQRVFVVWNHKK